MHSKILLRIIPDYQVGANALKVSRCKHYLCPFEGLGRLTPGFRMLFTKYQAPIFPFL